MLWHDAMALHIGRSTTTYTIHYIKNNRICIFCRCLRLCYECRAPCLIFSPGFSRTPGHLGMNPVTAQAVFDLPVLVVVVPASFFLYYFCIFSYMFGENETGQIGSKRIEVGNREQDNIARLSLLYYNPSIFCSSSPGLMP